MNQELQYLWLLQDTMDKIKSWELNLKMDRTGVGTYSEVGWQMIFDLEKWFPLLTSKKVFLKWIIYELLWFIQWNTNIRYLLQNNVHIWSEWAYKKYINETNSSDTMKEFEQKIVDDEEFAQKWGDLWPVYGKQWRDFNWVDQLKKAIDTLKTNPESRRIIVNSWNAPYIDLMALPPCHTMYQFIVNDDKLSLHLYQRSADMFLGVPFNIASYALLVHMVAKITGLKVGKFVHSFGDRHIYSNHLEQVELQLSRADKLYDFPKLIIHWNQKNIEDFTFEDFEVVNYQCHPTIKWEVAV